MEYSAIAALLDALRDPNAIDDRKMLVSVPPYLECGSPPDIISFPTVGADASATLAFPQGKDPDEAGAWRR